MQKQIIGRTRGIQGETSCSSTTKSLAPDGRCFPVARSVTLSTLFNLADRNRICLNGETPNDVQAGQRQTSFSGRGDAHLRG